MEGNIPRLYVMLNKQAVVISDMVALQNTYKLEKLLNKSEMQESNAEGFF